MIFDVAYCADCELGLATVYVVVDNQGMGASGDVDLVFTDSAFGEVARTTVSSLDPQESVVLAR